MDQQQQSQQTEKLIEEMLEFLDSTSEEEDEPAKFAAEDSHKATLEPNNDFNAVNNTQRDVEKLKTKIPNDYKSGKKTKPSIANELNKLKQQYPIWNTKGIVFTNKKAVNNPQSPATIAEPIWSQTSVNLLGKSVEDDTLPTDAMDNDWHTKLESNCRRSSNNSYIQEVQKAIYGDSMGHPPNGSTDYFQAAQNYAVAGKYFLDFPENLQTILNDKPNCSSENPNFVNGLYPISQTQGVLVSNGVVGNNGYVGGGITPIGYNNNVKPNTTTSNTISGSSTSAVAAAAASTAAYYQMCSGMQQQGRPTVSNANAGNAAAYGIFLGNKVTYVAAPTAPSMVYNQHTSTTTNFISNSLANAALASSPAILYSNPMLTTTTQQYLNTFFKETQFLSTGAATANSAQGSAVGTTTTGIYERLIYAQMLQQQIYHQTQQAAAVAAMFQHKQRATAAAAAAVAISRQPSNAGNVNIMTNGINATAPSATPTKTPSSIILPVLNPCGRQATMAVSNSPTPMATNSTPIPANGNDDVSNALTD